MACKRCVDGFDCEDCGQLMLPVPEGQLTGMVTALLPYLKGAHPGTTDPSMPLVDAVGKVLSRQVRWPSTVGHIPLAQLKLAYDAVVAWEQTLSHPRALTPEEVELRLAIEKVLAEAELWASSDHAGPV